MFASLAFQLLGVCWTGEARLTVHPALPLRRVGSNLPRIVIRANDESITLNLMERNGGIYPRRLYPFSQVPHGYRFQTMIDMYATLNYMEEFEGYYSLPWLSTHHFYLLVTHFVMVCSLFKNAGQNA